MRTELQYIALLLALVVPASGYVLYHLWMLGRLYLGMWQLRRIEKRNRERDERARNRQLYGDALIDEIRQRYDGLPPSDRRPRPRRLRLVR